MIITQRSAHRYPRANKMLASSLPKGKSFATFYSKEKTEKKSSEAYGGENRPTSIKEFIDVYFDEETKKTSNRMPTIKRRQQFLQTGRISDRKGKNINKEEELSKSVAYDDHPPFSGPLLPPPHLRYSVSVAQQLPSIHEQTEGAQQQKEEMAILSQTSQFSFMKKSSSIYSDINPEGSTQERTLTFENELFCVYIQLKDGKPVSRVKEFKDRGVPFMEREARMKNFGITSLWKESKYNHRSFIISLRPPIKDQLTRIMADEANPSQLKIKEKALHNRLMANHCQELCILLRNLCLQLKKVEGRVLNNKINPSNLFLRSSGLQLAEWGYSSFRQQFIIREGRFQKRRYGILKGEEWFVSPQYLAPEIIRQMLGEQVEVWGQKSTSDIWSLGLTFFEFITIIPIWITAKCSLVHRPAIVRSGILASPGRDLQILIKKQGGVQKIISKILANEIETSQQNQKLFSIIIRMVEPDLRKRISLDQIIESL